MLAKLIGTDRPCQSISAARPRHARVSLNNAVCVRLSKFHSLCRYSNPGCIKVSKRNTRTFGKCDFIGLDNLLTKALVP